MGQPGKRKPADARVAATSIRRVAKAARSGLKRYPSAIYKSFKDPYGKAPRPDIADLPDLGKHDLAAVWLGHGSVLVRTGGVTVLMDPVLSYRIGMSIKGMTFGLPRLSPIPAHPERLPPIDLILISHAHFDHLDKPTLRRLANPKTTVITARKTAKLIPEGFGDVRELDWGKSVDFRGLHLSALRPEHWGARTALDRKRGYNSYILRTGSHGLLLAGDTAMTDAFDKLTDLTLSVMGIGSYEPWEHAHATPEQVWEMFRASGAEKLLPVHHSTFPLGDEHIDEPLERLMKAADPDHHKVIPARPGDVWHAA
jgi:L-ascorbate metabolism protein UlaG (beta-lactamase superfamily)